MLFKTFYKSLFSLIFFALIIANLVIIFDVSTGMPIGRVEGPRFVGISAFFDFLNTQSADSLGLSTFNTMNAKFYEWNMAHFQVGFITSHLTGNWYDVFIVIADFISFIILPVTLALNAITYFFELMTIGCYITIQFAFFLSGVSSNPMPPLTYPLT